MKGANIQNSNSINIYFGPFVTCFEAENVFPTSSKDYCDGMLVDDLNSAEEVVEVARRCECTVNGEWWAPGPADGAGHI